MALKSAVFIDKDGTLIDDEPFNVDPARMRLAANAGPALRKLQALGYLLIVVSNQPGIARGLFTASDLEAVKQRLSSLLGEHRVTLDAFCYCPHWPMGRIACLAFACDCRKPQPGMLLRAAASLQIRLAGSWMVGDILDDIEAGRRAGCRTILIDNGNETEWQVDPLRHPHRLARDLGEAASVIAAHSSQ